MQQLANAVHSHSDESDEASLIEPIEHIGRRHCNQGHPSSQGGVPLVAMAPANVLLDLVQ